MWVLRTTLLLGAMTGLLLAVGVALAYVASLPFLPTLTVAFVLAMSMNLIMFFYADKWVLRMYRAKLVSEQEQPTLHRIVSRLAERAGIPKPRVAVVPLDIPNAFATGRNAKNAVVAVTRGAMEILKEEELEGVIGHELAHIKNRDMLVSTLAAIVAGAISYLALVGRMHLFWGSGERRSGGSTFLLLLALILVPLAALMIRLAVSRTREYGADEEGARISGKPLALASALKRLEDYSLSERMAEGNPATSHLFIVNPFRGSSLVELFSTHPSTEKRIQRLEALARESR
ncbi:MAG: zinc metalloprotease HtpX [Candidatus Hadarchaeales archaeon]